MICRKASTVSSRRKVQRAMNDRESSIESPPSISPWSSTATIAADSKPFRTINTHESKSSSRLLMSIPWIPFGEIVHTPGESDHHRRSRSGEGSVSSSLELKIGPTLKESEHKA